MKLTRKKLLGMLARAERPAAEQVVARKLVRRTIGFNKDEWRLQFSDWPGIELEVGKTVKIVRSEAKARKLEVTDAVCERLGLGKDDTLYVTRRESSYFLKKLELVRLPPVLPGFYIFDSFSDTSGAGIHWAPSRCSARHPCSSGSNVRTVCGTRPESSGCPARPKRPLRRRSSARSRSCERCIPTAC